MHGKMCKINFSIIKKPALIGHFANGTVLAKDRIVIRKEQNNETIASYRNQRLSWHR